jgi:hypothetical protein
VGVAHGNTDLSDPAQPLFDQALMAAMERLVAADEQRRRLLRIESRSQQRQRLLGPILRRAFGADAQIVFVRRNEHPVGVGETPGIDAVEPDDKRIAEYGAGLLGRADEIGDHGAAGLDDAVAHPAHAAGMLDAVFVRADAAVVVALLRANSWSQSYLSAGITNFPAGLRTIARCRWVRRIFSGRF